MPQAYITAATRTAGGKREGRVAGWHPVDLAAAALDEVVARAGIAPDAVDDVIMGCVSQVGEQGLHFGRNAVLASGLPQSVPAVTIDRQCGSSQQSIHFAAQAVMSGTQDIVIAAGAESMSRVAMGSTGRWARRAVPGSPTSPKLARAYPEVMFSQFTGAEMIARKWNFSRADLDAYALGSHQRAIAATDSGAFAEEILPLKIQTEGGPDVHDIDEGIRCDATLDSIGAVRPLVEGGVITAANASQICDGAAAVMVVSEAALKAHNLTPLARIHHLTVTAGDPVVMLEEPLFATDRALQRAGLRIDDIDLFEVNEAFAPVPLAWLKRTGADPERLNVNGGAIALGHPLGGSGAKLMTTLVHALRARGKRFGLQTMCEGGGIANVTIIEAL
ncbi:acetyl-CoA C-acetyltransferase [Sedimentitalea nanhaiensis]|uniref:Acetyl-CoA C-acetyltransferase n=1 Tax=Sedimentitalea nanhaiensis TaxID=999627 RepID=A0A1I6X808_9RHOB|nr:acetyl-CoA C-acetyltransferase [Sedimentitalea nanhaiensis]SFT34367.1 acetyl-CoA C-acetyltransferase [Sedimentitalea nanhaiensis]